MNYITYIYNLLDEYFSSDDKEQINSLNKQLEQIKEDYSKALITLEKEKSLKNEAINKNNDLLMLKNKKNISEDEEISKLEQYWNNKIRPSNYLYSCRMVHNNNILIPVDPRIFYQINDNSIPTIKKNNYDEIAIKSLNYVHAIIKYTSDKNPSEFWQFPFETMNFKKGDCEDGAILLANIMIKSGIPYWRVRLVAGNVKGGGHAYVTYLSEKDNEWYILDWTYWYNESKGLNKKWKDAEKYFDIWFSWNMKYIFKKDNLDRENVN